MNQTGVPLILGGYVGNEAYYIGHLVAAVMDAKDSGDWKGEILYALREEAERRKLGPNFFTNDGRRFALGVPGVTSAYGWTETT